MKIFVELNSGAILRGHGQCQLAKLHGAEGVGGSLHEHAAEAVPLIAGEYADLRGVSDAGGDLAGEHGGDEFVAPRLAQNKGRAGNELSATRGKKNVLEKA